MLTEDKIIEHANFLLEKRTLTPAEYHGWISGATWANGENAQHLAKIEMVKESYLKHWNMCIENGRQCEKDWTRKHDAVLKLVQIYKDQSGSQKEQIAELVAELKNLSYAAQTTGGTAGVDRGLMAAISDAEQVLKKYEQ